MVQGIEGESNNPSKPMKKMKSTWEGMSASKFDRWWLAFVTKLGCAFAKALGLISLFMNVQGASQGKISQILNAVNEMDKIFSGLFFQPEKVLVYVKMSPKVHLSRYKK